MDEEEEMNFGWNMQHSAVVEAIKTAARKCYAGWFFTEDEFVQMPDEDELREAALTFCQSQRSVASWKATPYVPRFGSRTLVYLHLFSGHRRSGDIQQYLGEQPAPDGAIVVALSVDVIYDSKAGDLADVAHQKVWRDFAKRGCIAGAFAGPPCETWSRARSLGGVPGFSFGDGGPRLLRTSAQPEGLGNMKVEELQQVILANRFLAFTVMPFAVLAMAKRFMAMEHPACPSGQGDEWLPSIWKLYILRALAAMDGVRLLEIQQGLFDGISPKPTFLLILCGDIDAQKELARFQTTDTLPKGIQMGYDKSRKEFSTAALKSYPPPRCKALASLAGSWSRRFGFC